MPGMWQRAVLGGGAAGSHAKTHRRKTHKVRTFVTVIFLKKLPIHGQCNFQVPLLPLDGIELVGAQQAQNCHAQDGEGAREDEEAALPRRAHGRTVHSRAVRGHSVIESGVQSKTSDEKNYKVTVN